MNILSIQSWVAYGHVGNASAVFPLQRLGAEVWAVNTVQFSNHPGYGDFAGAATPPALIAALVEGIARRGVLPVCDALLTGYVGAPGTGEAILKAEAMLRAANPASLWCCDPVMGDEGPGLYVQPGVVDFFRDHAVARADILTPNQFELRTLTGYPCGTLAETLAAVAALQARMRPGGKRIVLVTSLRVQDTPDDAVDCLVAGGARVLRLRLPKLPIAPQGAGDAVAALFLFHLLATADAGLAMSRACSAVHGILRGTLRAGRRELALIACQDEIMTPALLFRPEACDTLPP